jgi:predicted membrane protein (TIGR00267 family)
MWPNGRRPTCHNLTAPILVCGLQDLIDGLLSGQFVGENIYISHGLRPNGSKQVSFGEVQVDLIEGFQGTAFGVMDGVITILGVVIGVAEATGNATLIVVTGTVAGVANAFGNSIGFYASELAERGEHIRENKAVASHREMYRSSILSFISSLVAMILPVSPFLLLATTQAMILAVCLATALLFALGSYVGHLSHMGRFSFGLRYVALGLMGAGLAYLVGDLLKSLLM